MDAAVLARALTKRFGRFTAVDRLDLAVRPGEIFGVLGSNGAGKSTAIRMLCGLLAPSGGTAEVLGIDVGRDPDAVKRAIGYMSQRFSLYDDLTVAQNLHFFGGVYGLGPRQLAERCAWASRMAGLEGKEQLLTGALPGGWKQRLALASALLHAPKVVFLDEPTGGVDPLSRRRFWSLIDELAGSGVTVIVTTHYLDEAEHCGRIALMHAGRLVALGTVSELKDVFAGRAVLEVAPDEPVAALEALQRAPWVLEATLFGDRLHLVVDDETAARVALRGALDSLGMAAPEPARIVPSLEDVFIHAIDAASRAEAP